MYQWCLYIFMHLLLVCSEDSGVPRFCPVLLDFSWLNSCSSASPEAVWETKSRGQKPFPLCPVSPVLLSCLLTLGSGTVTSWSPMRGCLPESQIALVPPTAYGRWSKPQKPPSWGAPKTPCWKMLMTSLKSAHHASANVRGAQAHRKITSLVPPNTSSRVAAELANTSYCLQGSDWANADFREVFLTSEVMYFQLNLLSAPKPATKIYLLCLKSSRTWYVFYIEKLMKIALRLKFIVRPSCPLQFLLLTEILSKWLGIK